MKIATVMALVSSSWLECPRDHTESSSPGSRSHRFAASARLPRPLDLPPASVSSSFAGAVNGGEEVRVGLIQHHSSRRPKFRADVAALIDATSHTIGV
jgi:hypothetical protein